MKKEERGKSIGKKCSSRIDINDPIFRKAEIIIFKGEISFSNQKVDLCLVHLYFSSYFGYLSCNFLSFLVLTLLF